MKTYRWGATAVMMLVAGCATMDKSECRTADWRMIGLEDGASGHPLTYVGRHRKACAEHGVRPDLAQYERGHADGVLQFCTPDNGYRHGRAGRSYQGVCPAGLSGPFIAAYETGLELHQLSFDIGHLQREVRGMQGNLADLQQERQRVENRLVLQNLSPTQRRSLLDRFKQLQTEIATLEIDIRNAELAAAHKQGEYNVLDTAHAY